MKLEDMINKWRKEMDIASFRHAVETFEERAAIREFDAGVARLEAERLAMEEMEKRRKAIDKVQP